MQFGSIGFQVGRLDGDMSRKTECGRYPEYTAEVFSLDYEGRGVARIGGKTVFIKGALPSETVRCRVVKQKKQFDEAETVAVLKTAAERVVPECVHFDTCGGCVLQHVALDAQVAYKQRILEEQLLRIGKVQPEQILPPLYGKAWYYRDRGRLSVVLDKTGRLKLGFRAKNSHDVVDLVMCKILPEHVSSKLSALRHLLQTLTVEKQHVKYAEFSVCSDLSIFNLFLSDRPSEKASAAIRQFADEHLVDDGMDWQIWLQHPQQDAYPFYPKIRRRLAYRLPEFEVYMPYLPGDFTQINSEMNRVMVDRALGLLDVRPGERVADLFCGLGNFTLPIAKQGADAVGIEGSQTLVKRAKDNAVLNNCKDTTVFQTADLFETDEQIVASWGHFDKMLLDPPRSGAYEVVKSLHAPYLPSRIIYISCNPSTFARDASVLVKKGYGFKAAGVMNMFAQTAHVESVGLFELKNDDIKRC